MLMQDEYELVRIHRDGELQRAEKLRTIRAITAAHSHGLRFEFGHLLVRVGLWLEGMYAAEEEPLRFQRRLHAH